MTASEARDRIRGIRGAIAVDEDTPAAIYSATSELLQEMVRRNGFTPEDVISALFTMTGDLTSAFPAVAARNAGWTEVPLLCATEIAVPGALPHCIRILVHVERPKGAKPVEPVYLGAAKALRPDLHREDATGSA